MTRNTQKCSGKDKRLLVLLSFGGMVISLHLFSLLMPDEQLSGAWQWRQTKLNGSSILYRTSMNDAEQDRSTSAPFFSQTSNNVTGLSPRVSFLLGLSFPVNNANIDELTMLPGIGPKLARSIVRYRDTHGPVTGRHDFIKIPGIGRKRTNRISPLLTFEVQ